MAQQSKEIQHRTHISHPYIIEVATGANPEHPDRNEDYLDLIPESGLVMLCDGVGSSIGAEQAGYIASTRIKSCWQELQDNPSDALPCFPATSATIHYLLEEANKAVLALGESLTKQLGEKEHAATTIVLGALSYQQGVYKMAYGYIGDSRIYLLRRNEALQRLTIDDGYFSLMQSRGDLDEQAAYRIEQANVREELSETELEHFDRRHGILQALGDEKINVHTEESKLFPGDRILFCTDGIHDNLTDKEIETILRSTTGTWATKALVQQARTRSLQNEEQSLRAKKDDMSVIVLTNTGL